MKKGTTQRYVVKGEDEKGEADRRIPNSTQEGIVAYIERFERINNLRPTVVVFSA